MSVRVLSVVVRVLCMPVRVLSVIVRREVPHKEIDRAIRRRRGYNASRRLIDARGGLCHPVGCKRGSTEDRVRHPKAVPCLDIQRAEGVNVCANQTDSVKDNRAFIRARPGQGKIV